MLIVVFIIGLGASLVMPRLLRRSPDKEWPSIQSELSNMLYFARQEAITSQKVHRIVFDKRKRRAIVEVDAGEHKPGVRAYEPIKSMYYTSEYQLPEGVSFLSLVLGKKELFEENKGIGWCYVVPHGLVQDIVLKMERIDMDQVTQRIFKVAPFLGTIEMEGDDRV